MNSSGEHGYTLVEIGVAMTLSGLVLGLAFQSYLLARKAAGTWQRKLERENDVHVALTRVTRDLYEARAIRHPTAGTWTLRRPAAEPITYTRRGGRLYRSTGDSTAAGRAPPSLGPVRLRLAVRRAKQGKGARWQVARARVASRGPRDTLAMSTTLTRRPGRSWNEPRLEEDATP